MTDELTAESVLETLRTGSNADVRRLLGDLRARGQTGRAITLPTPTHAWLGSVQDISDETVATFLDLLRDYPRFDPPLDPDEMRQESLEANLRYGGHRSGFQHALLLATSPMPDLEVSELLLRLNSRGITGAQETEAAKWLISYLLDSAPTRRATVRALWWMCERDDLAPVVEYVRPQLEPDEIAELDS